MKKLIINTSFLFFIYFQLSAQEFSQAQKNRWLEIAEANTPALVVSKKNPITLVSILEDSSAFQGFKAEAVSGLEEFYNNGMKQQSGKVFDFGEHLTGFLTVKIDEKRRAVDAPVRLKFTFAETPAEAILPFDPYSGSLSRSWLQDEIVTVTEVPCTITVPRRVSFRYVRIDVLGTAPDFRISDISLNATTSVKVRPEPLASSTPELIKKIDKVALCTLKECMQTVYEDGPKRDRRLWIGDLYLEMLSNKYSFKNDSLTKRCLYLFAGLIHTDGVVQPCVFERPKPHPQINPLFDYALIYNVVLKEYLDATGDFETANDLWPVVKSQIQFPKKYIMENGLIDYKHADEEWWLFFDWNKELDKQACMQGCVIWSYKNTYELAKKLGKENEVKELPGLINKLTKAARKNLYDKKQGVFISGDEKQISYGSQAWMVLSGVASKEEGNKAFKKLHEIKNVVYPGAPYMYHYVVDAMINVGLTQEAKDVIISYWGGMVKKGADTFWEVFDPDNDFFSPSRSILVNSYCHAWACTPTYFIRKYPEIFQNDSFD